MSKTMLRWLGTGMVILFSVLITACTASHETSHETVPAATVAATPAPATSSAPATPSMTMAEQQAVESAQAYLGDGSGFSEEGLMQQLTSTAGSGFPQADAQFAISYLHPDWDKQAVEAAEDYLHDGSGFSPSGLYAQLTSPYGSGFTSSQADYALKVVGM